MTKISIIIPAHNEENVVCRTLAHLVAGVESGEIEVIVVCNGCTDGTAEKVTSCSPSIKCIETSIAGKSNALNLGDKAACCYPRFYQDADVIMNLDSIRKVAAVLQHGLYMAAAPKMQMILSASSLAVRCYYDVWQQLPYVQEGMIGVGVYALSEAGRKRFERFPELIADDGYIRALFTKIERTSVPTGFSYVRAPANLHGLIKIKTRSRLGGYQLQQMFPELLENEEKKYDHAAQLVAQQIDLWPKIPIYLLVNMVARLRAKRYARQFGYSGWERDDSSRYN